MSYDKLIGLTIEKITNLYDELHFKTKCNRTFVMKHDQDCCESVYIDDIAGDLIDLVGEPILIAEEVNSDDTPLSIICQIVSCLRNGVFKKEEYEESYTWTFYKLATIKFIDDSLYKESEIEK